MGGVRNRNGKRSQRLRALGTCTKVRERGIMFFYLRAKEPQYPGMLGSQEFPNPEEKKSDDPDKHAHRA